jgi:hypothetical protein
MNENHDAPIASPPLESGFPEIAAKPKKILADFTLEEFGERTRGGIGKGKTRRWRNPLTVSIECAINLEPISDAEKIDSSRLQRVIRFAPGETRELPLMFDRVLHVIHHNEIIGGALPMAVAIDLEDPPVAVDAIRSGFAHLIGETAK